MSAAERIDLFLRFKGLGGYEPVARQEPREPKPQPAEQLQNNV